MPLKNYTLTHSLTLLSANIAVPLRSLLCHFERWLLFVHVFTADAYPQTSRTYSLLSTHCLSGALCKVEVKQGSVSTIARLCYIGLRNPANRRTRRPRLCWRHWPYSNCLYTKCFDTGLFLCWHLLSAFASCRVCQFFWPFCVFKDSVFSFTSAASHWVTDRHHCCVTCLLIDISAADMSAVWHVCCVTCLLRDTSAAWHVGCVTCLLCRYEDVFIWETEQLDWAAARHNGEEETRKTGWKSFVYIGVLKSQDKKSRNRNVPLS